jgi:hypothetical protein
MTMDQQAIQTISELHQKATEVLRSVLSRSATDVAYRQRLLTNPREAITEVTGKPLPADYNVAFVESKADVTLVLPKPVKATELSEGDLDTVSGGTLSAVGATLAAVVSAVAASVSTDDWRQWWDSHQAPTPQVIPDDDNDSNDWMNPTIPSVY